MGNWTATEREPAEGREIMRDIQAAAASLSAPHVVRIDAGARRIEELRKQCREIEEKHANGVRLHLFFMGIPVFFNPDLGPEESRATWSDGRTEVLA